MIRLVGTHESHIPWNRADQIDQPASKAVILPIMTARRSARLSSSAAKESNGTSSSNGTDTSTTAPKSRAKSAKPTANSSAKRKTPKASAQGDADVIQPSTPKVTKKRKVAEPVESAPAAEADALPSNVKLMAAPVESPVKTPRRAPPRRVDPHATNALLKTPAGSRVSAYPADSIFAQSPSQQPANDGALKPVTTTENLLKTAEEHLLKIDPKLGPLIAQHKCTTFSPAGLAEEIDPFTSLVSSIIAQQVSGAAAASIKRKFIELFYPPPPEDEADGDGKSQKERSKSAFPTPAMVAAKDLPTLRTAGLSQRKAEYIQGLAEKFVSGELSARMLVTASDEEVLEKLTAVRGLGKYVMAHRSSLCSPFSGLLLLGLTIANTGSRWSVEMFSCFSLKRMDIFSTGDLGVQ
jgi:DNA-3-methyladenine glycosylase II